MADVPRTLRPLLPERLAGLLPGSGWRRTVALRRAVAAVLAAGGVALLVLPAAGRDAVAVTVAARDLPAGTTLTADDLRPARFPADLVPAGALPAPTPGGILAAPVRAGEPITDARLAGPGPLPAGSGRTAAVPVRLADAGVGALLVPGHRVDVVTLGPRADEPRVLASDAVVLAVPAADRGERGRLVLLALPREAAARVAAAALSAEVTVTLR